MPPRIREAKKMLRDAGFAFVRQGKGDHTVWKHPSGVEYSLDGADSKEMPKGTWLTLRKLLDRLKETS